jgi:hypothetical protein
MSSRRIRAMAQLINDIESTARKIPCTHQADDICCILDLIKQYRISFQRTALRVEPKAEPPNPIPQSNPKRGET